MTRADAYQLGVRLALIKVGMLETTGDESEPTNFQMSKYPAEELASVLQSDAKDPGSPPANPKKEAIGAPDNPNSTYSGAPTQSFGNDMLSRLGVDIRGPESTAI